VNDDPAATRASCGVSYALLEEARAVHGSVPVNLWKIDDEATAALMRFFAPNTPKQNEKSARTTHHQRTSK
jgi:hypothetical protein